MPTAPKIDWRKHDKAISNTVKSLTLYFTGTEPNRATPAKFLPTIVWLEKLTAEVRKKRRAYGASDSPTVPQWVRDFDAWEERLAAYGAVTRQAISIDPDDRTAADFTARVTMPLLFGWYPDPEQKAQKPPDVVTPLSLAFAQQVHARALSQAWSGLWRDLKKGGAKAGIGIGAALVTAGVVVGGAVLLTRKD